MKKTIIIFIVAGMMLVLFILWALNAYFSWNIQGSLTLFGGLTVTGFAVYIGLARVKSSLRNEPLEDELSKKIMTKATSLSYFVSLYLWLFIMYISDRVAMETDTLIGAGILGMAIIFFLSWIGIKLYGFKNG